MENLKTIALGILTFLIIYLLGSFNEATFYIKDWNELTRFFITFIGGLAAIVVIIINYVNKNI